MKTQRNPALESGVDNKGKATIINFLDLFYDKAVDVAILNKFVYGQYPAMLCALGKAKLEQVELQRKGGLL